MTTRIRCGALVLLTATLGIGYVSAQTQTSGSAYVPISQDATTNGSSPQAEQTKPAASMGTAANPGAAPQVGAVKPTGTTTFVP